jgi:hypothetical protein
MSRVGREPTIPVFERAKTVHVLERAATVIGPYTFHFGFRNRYFFFLQRKVVNLESIACVLQTFTYIIKN